MQHLDPVAAHAFLRAEPQAVLVDCRTEIEHMYVGHPPGAEHVAWQEAPDWDIDQEFADKVKWLVGGDLQRAVLLKTREKLEALERTVAELEAQAGTSSDAARH